VLAVAGLWLDRRAMDVLGTLVAAATTVLCVVLLVHVGSGTQVHWFGGWHPRGGIAIGIDFAADGFGLGLAAFVASLMTLAFVYTSGSIESDQEHYHPLMLVFMAAMVGFAQSGDLFNLFVFFELMSVAGVALVGYLSDRGAAIEGALNFGVVNTLGSFVFLAGIALLYGRTGALNLAQIGASLERQPADALVFVAFALLVAGFLVKAGAVPFHFWLADAYAVAPAAVCLLLAGAMSEMGLFGVGRVYFTAFDGVLHPHADTVRAILVALGGVTALWGAVLALAEDHLKRMLAMVTISYVGVFLCGLGLLSSDGVGGAAQYVLADGCGKAGLFGCVGILQHRSARVGQGALHGAGRRLPGTAVLWFALAFVAAALPPFGSFLAKSSLDDAAIVEGYRWLPAVLVLAAALSSGAVLRAGARVFLGWGSAPEPIEYAVDEASEPHDRTPVVMTIPVVVLLAGAMALGVWFGFADLAKAGAARFVDHVGYLGRVLHGAAGPLPPSSSSAPRWFDFLYGGGAVAGAVAVAAIGLWGRLDLRPLVRPLTRLHSGRVGDYVAWFALGAGGIATLMLAAR
jgi:multicomponent Na+:H+ antiporter subunit D